MTAKHVLQQILNDPYRSPEQKAAARAELDQQSGLVRERVELDKNAEGLSRVLEHIARQDKRIAELEAEAELTDRRIAYIESLTGSPGTPGPAVIDPLTTPPVEPTPQAKQSDGRGQQKGRPKARYAVEGERGNWGIVDRETGVYVWPVQTKRKDADKACRDINAGRIVPETVKAIAAHQADGGKTPLQREAETSVALDKDPDCGTQSLEAQAIETAEGTIPPPPAEPTKMYRPEEEKPAPEVRPEREKAVSRSTGRVPWYAK